MYHPSSNACHHHITSYSNNLFSKIHFISPRFIALRHPTLQSMLVQAKLNPTDEQLIDISFTIEPPSDAHIENAKLPNLSRNQPLITACKHSHCVTCRYHLLRTTTFQSTHQRNRTTYRIRHSLTCTSRNIIYLITCTKCNKQQVNKKSMDYKRRAYRDGIKRKGDRIGMEYEDIVSMLILPEAIAQTLLLLPGVLLHLGNNIGFVRLSLGVSACSQCLHIPSQSCLLSFLCHPYMPSFL